MFLFVCLIGGGAEIKLRALYTPSMWSTTEQQLQPFGNYSLKQMKGWRHGSSG
jgi:hypothetical protein